MIPGSISKVSEGIVACADVIKVYNDLVRITGSGTINTINPGLGTAQGQYLMLIPMDADVTLGSGGNILGGDLIIPRNRVITLVFSKLLQRWLLPVSTVIDEVEVPPPTPPVVYVPYSPTNFFADNGGTWTVPSNLVYSHLYYVNGKRVTMSFVSGASIIQPSNLVKQIRVRLPSAVSNVVKQGIHSSYPDEPSGFVGSSVISTDIDLIAVNAIPSYCAVSDNNQDVPWANMSVTIATGTFPVSPTGYFVIMATCTYIIE